MGFRVQGAGFRVQGVGFRVQGVGWRVQGVGFRVQGVGIRTLLGYLKCNTWVPRSKETPTPIDPPQVPRRMATVGTHGGVFLINKVSLFSVESEPERCVPNRVPPEGSNLQN